MRLLLVVVGGEEIEAGFPVVLDGKEIVEVEEVNEEDWDDVVEAKVEGGVVLGPVVVEAGRNQSVIFQ